MTAITLPWYEKIRKHTQLSMLPADRVLYGPNSGKLDVIGMAEMPMCTGKHPCLQNVYIISSLQQPLLGRPDNEALQVLPPMPAQTATIAEVRDIASATAALPSLFESLGKFKGDPYKISFSGDAKLVSQPCPRQVPFPVYPKVKEELERMRQRASG